MLLELCKKRGISTAVDTSGYAAWQTIERSADYVDLFLYDIKDYDARRHRMLTGVSNDLIVSNLRNLIDCGKRVVVRIPFVQGCNFRDSGDFDGFAKLLEAVGAERVDVLPYHSLAKDKYRWLGRKFFHPPECRVEHGEFVDYLKELGYRVTAGGYF